MNYTCFQPNLYDPGHNRGPQVIIFFSFKDEYMFIKQCKALPIYSSILDLSLSHRKFPWIILKYQIILTSQLSEIQVVKV